MAINFPSNPSVNDTHTANSITWKWDGTTWKVGITTFNAATIPGISTTRSTYFYDLELTSVATEYRTRLLQGKINIKKQVSD